MTIERKIINGHFATVAYFDEKFNLASKKDHKLVKVIFDDGTIEWLTKKVAVT